MLQMIVKSKIRKSCKMGGDETSADDAEKLAEQQAAMAEALAEEKRKRDEKHRKMEAEREELRQGIRDKYKIQKKEEFHFGDADDFGRGGGAGRRRKSPEELAAERNANGEPDLASYLPEGVRDTVRSVTGAPHRMLNDAQEKCAIQ